MGREGLNTISIVLPEPLKGIPLSPLRTYVGGPIIMDSFGKGFSPLVYVLPQAYRTKQEPSGPFDGMAFVPYAYPTETRPQS